MKNTKIKTLVLIFSIISLGKCIPLCAEPSSPKQSMSYHGMRIANDASEFNLLSSKIERLENNRVQIDFLFDQGVDPRSVNGKSVKLNNKVLPMDDTKFLFSKDGKMMRLMMNVSEKNFSVTLEGIMSFSEVSLKRIEIQY